MFQLDEFRSCLARVSEILRTCRVRYFLTGGAAAIAYGDPDLTGTVHFVVDADVIQTQLSNFLDQLKQHRFVYDEASIGHAVVLGQQFQIFDNDSMLKLALYAGDLVPGSLGRAVEIEILPGLEMPVASRPDLVLSKLIWISKGSHKSRRDVKQVMLRVNRAETELVYELADQMKLRMLLEEVLAEPDEIDV